MGSKSALESLLNRIKCSGERTGPGVLCPGTADSAALVWFNRLKTAKNLCRVSLGYSHFKKLYESWGLYYPLWLISRDAHRWGVPLGVVVNTILTTRCGMINAH